jgi:hypothetical protein
MTPVFGIVLLFCVVIITIIVIYATCGYESGDAESCCAINQIERCAEHSPDDKYYLPSRYAPLKIPETWQNTAHDALKKAFSSHNHDGVSQASPHTGLSSMNYGGTGMEDGLLYALGQRQLHHYHTGAKTTGIKQRMLHELVQWECENFNPRKGMSTIEKMKEHWAFNSENDLLQELRASVNKWLEPVKL